MERGLSSGCLSVGGSFTPKYLLMVMEFLFQQMVAGHKIQRPILQIMARIRNPEIHIAHGLYVSDGESYHSATLSGAITGEWIKKNINKYAVVQVDDYDVLILTAET